MGMIAAKRGARGSEIKIRISEKNKLFGFTAGFLRKFKINKNEFNFLRQGFDESKNKIGIEFVTKEDESGELNKLTFNQTGSSATCSAAPVLRYFNLKIEDLAGDYYYGESIEGPLDIPGFSKNGFLLDIAKRKK